MEQIISSHSAVTGAGELSYVEIFGHSIATGMRKPHIKTIINFRKSYIEALNKWSKNSFIVTDKMPANFRYAGLIFWRFQMPK